MRFLGVRGLACRSANQAGLGPCRVPPPLAPNAQASLAEGFNDPDHAAQRYSWIRPPSTSLRSTGARVVSRTCGVRSPAGTAKPSPRLALLQVVSDVGLEHSLEVPTTVEQYVVEALFLFRTRVATLEGVPSARLATRRHIAGDSEDAGYEPNRRFCTLHVSQPVHLYSIRRSSTPPS
jgi:hypothetical protein